MKPTTNETIFENVRKSGYISEREINLLKNRSNKEGHDLFNYDLVDEVGEGYGVPVTPEQGAKGLRWLQSLIKRNGEPKSGQNLGYREIEIIKNATPDDFSFVGFYDGGNKYFSVFVPVYRCDAMEYYVGGGKIQVIG